MRSQSVGWTVVHFLRKERMKKGLLIAFASLVATMANAQSRSSFLAVDVISDIIVNVSNGGLRYEVIVGANPTFTYQGTDYNITEVWGFWTLSDDDDLTVTNSDIGIWKVNNSNSGTGGIAGWKTQTPNDGLTPGQSFTFDYSALSVDKVERLGFDVRLDGIFPGTSGNTGRITVVPEPASMLALAVGVATLVRRRRK